jgi:hypothetical protein
MMRSLVISLVLLSCLCVPAHSFGFSLDTIKAMFSKPSGPHPPVFPSSFEVGQGIKPPADAANSKLAWAQQQLGSVHGVVSYSNKAHHELNTKPELP